MAHPIGAKPMKTVHYAAGCDKGYATIWKPLVVGQEVTPSTAWELVSCTVQAQVPWPGEEERDCTPPEGPGRIVTVYGEEATRAGSVCVRWFGPRGTVGSILATYRFDAKLA